MPFVSGFLKVRHEGGRPDQGLPPGEGPVDPDYGIGSEHPDHELPAPPPGIWPPPVSIWPPAPLPPDYPMPPGSIWPPVRPVRPDQALPRPPGTPDQGLPGTPGTPDQGLPRPPGTPDQGLPSQKFLVAIVAKSATGFKVIGYTVVDPSLHPGHDLPPYPQPK